MFVQYSAAGYERVKSSVFNLRLNMILASMETTRRKVAGKLFQTRAAATGNARSPIVECFVRGITSAAVLDDRNCLRESASATHASELGRQVHGAVPCWQRKASTVGRYAIFSPELVTNHARI